MTTFLAILTGGGLTIVGGVLSGWLTNWLGDKRDQRKYEHERAMAGDARRQDRLEQAYIDLLGYLAHHAEWARSVRPFIGAPPAPDPLPPIDVKRVGALVEAYGSHEVRGLMREWRERAGRIADADATIRLLEKSKNPSQELENEARRMHLAIGGYREAMFDAAEAIREQVRRELAGEA